MEANKPCNSGTTPQLAGTGQYTGHIIGVSSIRKIGRENRISKSSFFISKAGKIVRSQLAGIQRKLYIIVPTDRQDRLRETITKNRCKPAKNGLQRQFWHPWRESNSQLTLRRGLLYPFNYRGLSGFYSIFPRLYHSNGSLVRRGLFYPFNYGGIAPKGFY